jgi:hypothetical protein
MSWPSEQTDMNRVYRPLIFVAATLVYCGATSSAPPNDAETIELKVVKYDELETAVRAEKGKIVVVDIWAEY